MRTRTTTLNVELLRAALDAIEAHPEQWDAYGWATRTEAGAEFYSLAARVCLLVGDAITGVGSTQSGNATWLTNGSTIPDAARELLALDSDEAYKLFDVELDIARTRKIAQRLIKRAGGHR